MDNNAKGGMKDKLIDKGEEIIELRPGQKPEGVSSTNVQTEQVKTAAEKLKEAEDQEKALKKKAMDAWGNTGEKKSFGLLGMLKFTLPRLWTGSTCNKFVFLFNIAMVFVVKGMNVFVPIVMKEVIDSIVCTPDTLVEGTTFWLKSGQPGCPSTQQTYTIIGVYILVKFLADFLGYVREIPFANMGAVAEISIAYDVYDHVQRQCLAFHLGRETGKIIRIVSRGSQQFTQILRQIWFNLAPIMVELIMVLVIFATLFSWEFLVLQLVAIFLYVYLTYRLTEWRASKFKAMAMADQAYNQKATDSLLNFETVKYFNAEAHEEQRFEVALSAYKEQNIIVQRSLVALNITQAFIISLALAAILVLAYFFVLNGTMTIGGFVMFQQYNLQIYTPLGFLGTLWRWVRQAMVDVEQVLNLIEVDERIQENPNARFPRINRGEIKFENVSFTYDDKLPENEQRTVIDNVSFTVPAGKSVGIVGQTGSGKSTIMRLLYRFYDIQEGRITIDGQNIKDMKLADLRSHIAIVPQDCVLFNETIMYNIAYGGIREKDIASIISDKEKEVNLIHRIVPAAKRAQIHKFVMEKQLGYWEKVGERGLKLSGGEKQRVAIARALLKHTPIMCFDEATSALDTQTEREVQDAINEVSKGSTTLIIAHRLSTVMDCDKIIVLKHGVIVEEGSHNQLLDIQDGYYKRLWEKQSEQKEKMRKEAQINEALKREHEQAIEERKQQN